MSVIPTCCVTGRIAGDPLACGDCDPCGATRLVPDAVKRLIAERDEWVDKYAGAMMEVEAERARCAEIIQLARCGEVDRDWRCLINMIESGQSIEQIKSLNA